MLSGREAEGGGRYQGYRIKMRNALVARDQAPMHECNADHSAALPGFFLSLFIFQLKTN